MATAKPKTTKIEAPKLEEVVIAEAVEEALIEEPVAVEVILDTPQAPVEEVTIQEKVPFIGDQRTWHGAQTSQRYNARIQ